MEEALQSSFLTIQLLPTTLSFDLVYFFIFNCKSHTDTMREWLVYGCNRSNPSQLIPLIRPFFSELFSSLSFD